MEAQKPVLCIVGLGYVGLPLAHAFAVKGYRVIGYDISAVRIEELAKGHDRTGELSPEQLQEAPLEFSDEPTMISQADIIILAIPTPVDEKNLPDLTLLERASETIGKHLKKGAIVVYESTVYPGVTEEVCGPILERESGLISGIDFTLGYSPERINPGDKTHTVSKIMKIVSGQDAETLHILSDVYGSIVEAGIHQAPSIKVAEMAKAIENAQRDLNIAYVNEVAILCNALGIATKDVMNAAKTKWNFLPFMPGLVGGHCIGVDPYYLVEKARQLGLTTQVITAGRSVNDGMAAYIAKQVSDHLSVPVSQARILVLGLTFKEDCPDTRNSKVEDVLHALEARGATVEILDPYYSAEAIAAMKHTPGSLDQVYDAVLYLVPHAEYKALALGDLLKSVRENGVVYDLKSLLDGDAVKQAKRTYLAL